MKYDKDFFNLGNSYYIAASELYNKLPNFPPLHNPIVYLARHSCELFLKGLIISASSKFSNIKDLNDVKIIVNHKLKNISETHSLKNLWEEFVRYNEIHCLVPIYSIEEKRDLEMIIDYIDCKDSYSTTFRYPYDKFSKKNPQYSPPQLREIDISPAIGIRPPIVVINSANQIFKIIKGKNYIEIDKILKTLELLIAIFKRTLNM